MKVRYTRTAFLNISKIVAYVGSQSPKAARDVGLRIFMAADMLGTFPKLGHKGLAARTREWVVPGLPYIIVHVVFPKEDEIIILAIRHGAENRGEATYDP